MLRNGILLINVRVRACVRACTAAVVAAAAAAAVVVVVVVLIIGISKSQKQARVWQAMQAVFLTSSSRPVRVSTKPFFCYSLLNSEPTRLFPEHKEEAKQHVWCMNI